MTLLIPCIYPIIWVLAAIIMLLKWIFVDGWFIWATLAGIWLIWHLAKGLRFGFSSIKDSKKKRQIKADFNKTLVQRYNLSASDDETDVNSNISQSLTQIFGKSTCDNSVFLKFAKIIQEFENNYEVPSTTVMFGDLTKNLGLVNGAKIKFKDAGWPDVNSNCRCFSIKWKSGAVYFYPFACIIETSDSLDIYDWKDMKVSSTKGDPSHYSYLHERVDGGPDRRYKFNPAIPVYFYSALVFEVVGRKFNLIFHGENVAEEFEKLFRDYMKALATAGGVITANTVIEHGVSTKRNHEEEPDTINYAALFKRIIDERGKDILKERLFLSLLADHKVFQEKQFLRPFLETMTEEGYWSELTEGSPSMTTLNKIKEKFIKIHLYPEHEAAEAVSYLGYGLGITA